jgi:hypothetical protein
MLLTLLGKRGVQTGGTMAEKQHDSMTIIQHKDFRQCALGNEGTTCTLLDLLR